MSYPNWIPKIELKQMQYNDQEINMKQPPTPLDQFRSQKKETNYTDYIQDVFPVNIYDETSGQFPRHYFTEINVKKIQDIVKQGLKGVRKDGKNIIVSKENILSVMQSVLSNYPRTGLDNILLMVSSMIINMIKTEYETIEKNFSFNINVLLYDQTYGIKQYPEIKILKKRLTSNWNFNY